MESPGSNASERAARFLPTRTDTSVFHREKHISYWLRCLRSPLPRQYTSNDSNRMTLAFFTVSALDLLGVLFTRTSQAEREVYIEWIYRCQHPEGGFRAFPGTDLGDLRNEENKIWDPANVPATYFALLALAILGDDLRRVRRKSTLEWLRKVQRPDGSFGQTLGEGDSVHGGTDTRFGYCAMVTRWVLRGDQVGIVEGVPDVDVEALVQCIGASETYDGGFADEAFHEAHAGFTYCAIGALHLIDRLQLPQCARSPAPQPREKVTQQPSDCEATVRWLLRRLTDFVEEGESLDEDQIPDEDVNMPAFTSNGIMANGSEPLRRPDSPVGDLARALGESVTAPSRFEKLKSYPVSSYGPAHLPAAHGQGIPHLDDGTLSPASELNEEQASVLVAGFSGRPNKVADTCYAFWVGASLNMLHSLHLVDPLIIRRYLLEKTQHAMMGGFGKHTGDMPDLFHAYLGLAALSMLDTRSDHAASQSLTNGAPKAFENEHAPITPDTTGTKLHPNCHLSLDPDITVPPSSYQRKNGSPSRPLAAGDDGTLGNASALQTLDPALCVSERARRWIEGLDWRRSRDR